MFKSKQKGFLSLIITGNDVLSVMHYLPTIIVLFFCFAKRKVPKEKAIFFQRLRLEKRASRCYDIASIITVALVLALAGNAIKHRAHKM
jgi:hypothetical protein